MSIKEELEGSIELKATHLMVIVFILGLSVGLSGGLALGNYGNAQEALTADSPGNTDQESTGAQDSESTGDTAPSTVDISKIDIEGEPSIGSEDAQVTIVEYTDYQCPFCRRHATSTFPQLKQDYIDTGKVRYVVKDFPVPQLGHDRAVKMAKAANCAQEQGMYWEAHRKLFDEQNEIAPRSTAHFESSKIDDWMQEIGLDMEKYSACMDEGTSEINGDKREATSFETMVNGRRFVSGTPSFVIWSDGDERGQPIIGAQPYSIFQNRIESALQD